MTTAEVIKHLSKRLTLSQRAAKGRLRKKLDFLSYLLIHQQKVDLPDFGTVQIEASEQCRRYIPGKKTKCIVPIRRRAVFSMSTRLRQWIMGNKDKTL